MKLQYKKVHHITAGAGAGKTTELVRIITRLVNDGADPQRMILSTFTDAAATEFREKSKANLKPGDVVRMNGALMGTLHSIASRYINRYWYLLGISPSVKPVGQSVSGILMNRSLDGLITGEQKALLNQYVETFGLTDFAAGGYDYDFWKDTLKKLFDKMRGYGFGKDRIREFRDRSIRLIKDTFNQGGNQNLLDLYEPVFKTYLGDYPIVDAHVTDAGKKQYAGNCVQVNRLIALDPLKVDKKTLEEIGKMNWGRSLTISKKGSIKDTYESLLGIHKDDVANAAKSLSGQLVPKEYDMIATVADLLFDIMEAWMDAYDKIKKENGVIDFVDMEELFLRLLGKDEVKDDIKASVDYLFVDEFQDASPIQAQIYAILSEQIRQSWFVGDRKQAIYGFAGSDCGLIADLVESFPKEEEDKTSITGYKKDDNGNSSQVLRTSFRSVPRLVNAANAIFTEAFADTSGSLKDVIPEEHVKLEPLKGKADIARAPLFHVQTSTTSKGKMDTDSLAAFVCEMIEDPAFKNDGYTLSDVAILTRSGNQAIQIGKSLIKRDIRTGFVDPDGFQGTPEVSLVLAILRLSEGIDKAKSRAEIRKLVLDEDLNQLSKRVGQKKNDLDDFPGLEDFAKALRTHSVLDRINEIVTRFDLVGISGQWGNPDARRGSLNLLRQAAEEYADKSAILCAEADVRGFLSFLKDYKGDQKFDNSADGVKVLTYHKSKGLDWKIVILCGLDEYMEENSIGGVSVLGPSTKPESILMIPRLPDKDWVGKCIEENPESKKALEERQAVKRGEERRLLYVGFTRAKDVVITAAVDTDPKVLRVLCPTVAKRTGDPINPSQVDIWGIRNLPGGLSVFKSMPGGSNAKATGIPDSYRYRDAGFLLSTKPMESGTKYHSPSTYKDQAVQAAASVETAHDFGHRTDIPHNHLKDNVFGDCIHHIFARCAPGKHDGNLIVAASTLKGYGIQDVDAPGKAVASIEDFFKWLEDKYGQAESLEQEVPFRYTDTKGQVFSGTMDLVWRTAKGCILVDYKTFPGTKSDLFKPGNDHWAGNYVSQLSVYADALSVTDWNVPLDCLLYYPVEGLVIRVKG